MHPPTIDHVPGLKIESVECIALEVPFRRPLGTSAATMTHAPLLAIDVVTDAGLIGHAYLFCYRTAGMRALVEVMQDIGQLAKGEAVAPLTLAAKLERRLALLGVVGLVRMGLSALDMALWDLVAKAAQQPLWRVLGGKPDPIPAYNSTGLGLMGPAAVGKEALALLENGFTAVKLRVGYPTLAEDVAAINAVRVAVGDNVRVMTDYNQALDVSEALRRGRALQLAGAHWIEEPIRHDDWDGCAQLERALDVPISIGENFDGPKDLQRAHDLGAFDLAMPDLARIGGVSGWLQCARYAQGHAIPLSSHLFSEVSAQVLAATPTAHWLEYMDWADPILAEPLVIDNGHALLPERPGNGIAWNREGLARYRIDR